MSFMEASSATRARSSAMIMGQVLFLVGAAIGLCALGTVLGRDLSPGTAQVLSFAGLGMLIAQNFIKPLRYGPLGIGWLAALATLIGFGLGPTINAYATVDPSGLTTAVSLTALTVVGMGAAGFAWSKDVSGWARPLSMIVLVAVVISIIGIFVGGLGALSPVISLVILAVSAALILVYFNYMRKHATEDDVVWLATGIFVSIINIFISLLNLTR
ncbi:Bax inhibitor-1 family protein [Solirubrobacter ginsenosidimutans]|uniref:Bax inhibitor-1 family protein n=1 Tax=Solirubrobacter ginsenosidimutans TaxID=490573 RepID=A0A9X3MWJ2_9ACTN|nr:Bax inhibitor-1 family protein [Solirubrobacter ginsenosidimutans]MDA0163990.1 Bax inhibitor-1 family protein [Solirubrobacter ginsenosidimutans]